MVWWFQRGSESDLKSTNKQQRGVYNIIRITIKRKTHTMAISYTKWEKCLQKDRMHTLTCMQQILLFTFNYLELIN